MFWRKYRTTFFFFLKTKLSAIIFTADAFWSSDNVKINNNNKSTTTTTLYTLYPSTKRFRRAREWPLELHNAKTCRRNAKKKVLVHSFFYFLLFGWKNYNRRRPLERGFSLGDKTCVRCMLSRVSVVNFRWHLHCNVLRAATDYYIIICIVNV